MKLDKDQITVTTPMDKLIDFSMISSIIISPINTYNWCFNNYDIGIRNILDSSKFKDDDNSIRHSTIVNVTL